MSFKFQVYLTLLLHNIELRSFSYKLTTPQYSSIRSDERLTLETSVFLNSHGGNSTFINSFDKTKFLFDSLTDAAPQFL